MFHSMHILFRRGAGALLLTLILLPAGLRAQDTASDADTAPNPAGVVLQREHPDTFVGGEEVMVSVTISAASGTALYALGLYETPPAGWTFEGMYVDAGPTPDILPPLGATGVLEFGWVSPVVPVQLRYALRVPAQDEGARFLTGQVEYRLESDPKRNSAPVLTQLDGVANEKPVVVLRGAAAMSWTEGQVFVDPGASAVDKEDGDLSAQVEVAGRVDVSLPGLYTLTYGVIDSTGNRADPVSREVEVVPAEDTGAGAGGGNSGTANGGGAMPSGGGGAGGRGNAIAAKAVKKPAGANESITLIVPETALGESMPAHQLPPGHAGGTDGDTGKATGEEAAAGRLSRRETIALPGPADPAGVESARTPADTSAGESGLRAKVTRTGVTVALIVIPGAVGAAWWHGLFSRPRRRRR